MVKKLFPVFLEKIYKYYYYDDKGNKLFLNGDEDLCIINDKYYISIEVKNERANNNILQKR